MENTNEKPYESINHPAHYNQYDIEVVEMARRLWGNEVMLNVAFVTAFLYRMRLGEKPNVPFETDFKKEHWWLNYAKELKLKMELELKSKQ